LAVPPNYFNEQADLFNEKVRNPQDSLHFHPLSGFVEKALHIKK
jgi:hypothetical protein